MTGQKHYSILIIRNFTAITATNIDSEGKGGFSMAIHDEFIDFDNGKVTLAANLLIIRKMWDLCNDKKLDDLIDILGTKKKYIDDAIAGDGNNWFKYTDILGAAKRLGLPVDVLYGKQLLEIQGETIDYIQNHYEELLNSALNDDNRDIIEKMLGEQKYDDATEIKLWWIILKYTPVRENNSKQKEIIDKEEEMYPQAKRFMLRELKEQVEKGQFDDPALQSYYNSIKNL